MRHIRIGLAIFLFSLPLWGFAEEGVVDSKKTLAELSAIITQYEARIKQLQSENDVLRYEMAKAGMKIPLVALSGSMPASPSVPSETGSTIVTIPPPVSSTSITENNLSEITTKYGKDVAGFISRINKDWPAIRTNYGFPSGARLAGYELVQSGALDHFFADIIVGTGTVGVYDIKILYQFEKSEYKRKLIGLFIYDEATGRYTTRSGANPFAGVTRIFIKDPFYTGNLTPPPTVSPITPNGTTPASEVPVTPTTNTSTESVAVADITKAYNEKRYLSTISLSNSYLESNPPTKDILNIRYRTYFIIGKYSESLAELAKIEKLGDLDKQTACNAQVIATYSKNQSLVDKYTAICKK